jgi:hypothetical protein
MRQARPGDRVPRARFELAHPFRQRILKSAAEAGLRSLAKDPVVRHPPRELSGKYRPPVGSETWQHFDDAISEWQEAWQSGETLTVARALRRLSTLTEMLADEVDELRRSSARTAGEGASAAERRAAGE